MEAEDKTLVIGTQNFDGKFSPFFYTNAYENDVLSLVNVGLLGTDREGAVVLKQGDNILVIVGKTMEQTRGIYEALAAKIGQ